DESVMPQTREHFEICRLLGVQHGLIVLTKKDLVEDDLLELAREEAKELVAGSFLQDAPIIAVSSRTGEGLEELRTALRQVALQVPSRSQDFIARLPIDRAFAMTGFGAVVTGTLIAGQINEGEEMELLPDEARVRVRIGAAEILARIRVLEPAGVIAPGQTGLAQLRLESPIVGVLGDRFIIRSYSPQRTIGGGMLLDGFATKHRAREMTATHERL